MRFLVREGRMTLSHTAFALVICLFVPMQGEPQCSCFPWCGNDGTTFPGSNGEIVNVAHGKPANMSSRFLRDGGSGPACVAVNGRTGTMWIPEYQANTNCVHTNDRDYNAFWLVDLGRYYTVTNITVYRRRVTPLRMSGLSVFVDNQLCHSFPNRTAANNASLYALPKQINITCRTPLTGRQVRFQKHGEDRDYNAGGYIINICEVQVWACQDGLYGEQCDQTCSGHCKDNVTCDNYYGTCPTGCTAYTHGYDCGERCGQCADSDTCNTVTGLCPNGCQPGWQGDTCKQKMSDESSPNLAGPVAGAVFGGLCVIALSILVGLLIRRSRQRSSSETASPTQASNDQSLESGAPAELNGQVSLPEETGSAGGTDAEESHIYDGLQTPDDSDRAPYSTPVFKGKQDNGINSHTYQNPALHNSDAGKDYYNL